MKKRTILITTIVAVAALAGATLLYAGPGMHRGFRGEGFHGGMHGDAMGFGLGMAVMQHLAHVKAELGITDEQAAQLHQIFAEVHEQNAQYRDQMHDGFKAVADKLLADPNDIAGAQALLDQQDAVHRAMRNNILAATSKALNVLSADQRAKLGDMLAKRAERRERFE